MIFKYYHIIFEIINGDYSIVTQSKEVYDIEGETDREVDIEITEIENPKNKIFVESKYRSNKKRRIDITFIEQILEKARTLEYENIIIVSNNGFTASAKKKAEKNNIRLMEINEDITNFKEWLFPIDTFSIGIDNIPILTNFELILNPNYVHTVNTDSDNYIILENNMLFKSKYDYASYLLTKSNIIKYVKDSDIEPINNLYSIKIKHDNRTYYKDLDSNNMASIEGFDISFYIGNGSAIIPIKHAETDNGERFLTGNFSLYGRKYSFTLHETKERKATIMIVDEEGFILPYINPTLELTTENGEKITIKPEKPDYKNVSLPS